MSFNRMLLIFLLIVILLFMLMVALMPVENAGAMAVSPTPYPYTVYLPIIVSEYPMTQFWLWTWEPCGDNVICTIQDTTMCYKVLDLEWNTTDIHCVATLATITPIKPQKSTPTNRKTIL